MHEASVAVRDGDIGENYKLVAAYVARILRGANPGDLPVQQPSRYFLVINLKSASSLGIAIPSSLKLLADELVE